MLTELLSSTQYDLVIVGGGIIGLAHATLAARAGLKVAMVEKEAKAIGASIRNFGFITVTGQERGEFYAMAMRSSLMWRDLCARENIHICHEGLMVCVRRPEAVAVLDAFMQTEMGANCRLLSPSQTGLGLTSDVLAVLHSPHEIRLDSPKVIPILSQMLSRMGVDQFYQTTAITHETGKLFTSKGVIKAKKTVFCQGDALSGVFSERLAPYQVTRCKLQMLRLAHPGYPLPAAVMSDLGLVRYLGYSQLAEAHGLKEKLLLEQKEHLEHGVHLIVVQNADGSLVIGDSHHYSDAPDPFSRDDVDALILDEYAHVLGPPPPVLERWIGTYASSPKQLYFIDRPVSDVALCVVTSGTGASVSFGLAEKNLTEMGIELNVTA